MKQRDLWDETLVEEHREMRRTAKRQAEHIARLQHVNTQADRQINSLINSLDNLYTAAKDNERSLLERVRDIQHHIERRHFTVAWMLCQAVINKEKDDESK